MRLLSRRLKERHISDTNDIGYRLELPIMLGKVLTLNLLASTSIKGFSAKRKIRQKVLSSSHIRTIGTKDPRHIDFITALDATSSDVAVWENFEFSNSPKNTRLFKNKGTVENLHQETEDELDHIASHVLSEKDRMFTSLPIDVTIQAIEILEPYINAERRLKISQVLKQRTKKSMFLFENPINPSNVWACLRTIDSFGIQNVDVIINSKEYLGKQALNSKRGMRTAMGSAKWLSLRNHPSTEEAITDIRDRQGYKIYASDLNPNSQDIRNMDWNCGKICVVMGNEDRGISQEMRALADETFTLPMVGFAESFNLSVASAITLAHMSAMSKNGQGPLQPDMNEHEINCLYLKGLMSSLPQWKQGLAILKQKGGIILPDTIRIL